MLITCWILWEYGQGFLKQFRPRAAACQEDETPEPEATPITTASTTTHSLPLSHQPAPSADPITPPQNGQVTQEIERTYRPSEGLPEHTPNRPSEARPKSGKVLKRKNTPALLPKVEKLYAKDKVVHTPILCEEEDEEEEEEDGACGGGH